MRRVMAQTATFILGHRKGRSRHGAALPVEQRLKRRRPHRRIPHPIFAREMQPHDGLFLQRDQGGAGIAAQRRAVMRQHLSLFPRQKFARRKAFHIIKPAKIALHRGGVIAIRVRGRIAYDPHQFSVSQLVCRQRDRREAHAAARRQDQTGEGHIGGSIIGQVGKAFDLIDAVGIAGGVGLFHRIQPRLVARVAGGAEQEHPLARGGAPRDQSRDMAVCRHDQPFGVLADDPARAAP